MLTERSLKKKVTHYMELSEKRQNYAGREQMSDCQGLSVRDWV